MIISPKMAYRLERDTEGGEDTLIDIPGTLEWADRRPNTSVPYQRTSSVEHLGTTRKFRDTDED